MPALISQFQNNDDGRFPFNHIARYRNRLVEYGGRVRDYFSPDRRVLEKISRLEKILDQSGDAGEFELGPDKESKETIPADSDDGSSHRRSDPTGGRSGDTRLLNGSDKPIDEGTFKLDQSGRWKIESESADFTDNQVGTEEIAETMDAVGNTSGTEEIAETMDAVGNTSGTEEIAETMDAVGNTSGTEEIAETMDAVGSTSGTEEIAETMDLESNLSGVNSGENTVDHHPPVTPAGNNFEDFEVREGNENIERVPPQPKPINSEHSLNYMNALAIWAMKYQATNNVGLTVKTRRDGNKRVWTATERAMRDKDLIYDRSLVFVNSKLFPAVDGDPNFMKNFLDTTLASWDMRPSSKDAPYSDSYTEYSQYLINFYKEYGGLLAIDLAHLSEAINSHGESKKIFTTKKSLVGGRKLTQFGRIFWKQFTDDNRELLNRAVLREERGYAPGLARYTGRRTQQDEFLDDLAADLRAARGERFKRRSFLGGVTAASAVAALSLAGWNNREFLLSQAIALLRDDVSIRDKLFIERNSDTYKFINSGNRTLDYALNDVIFRDLHGYDVEQLKDNIRNANRLAGPMFLVDEPIIHNNKDFITSLPTDSVAQNREFNQLMNSLSQYDLSLLDDFAKACSTTQEISTQEGARLLALQKLFQLRELLDSDSPIILDDKRSEFDALVASLPPRNLGQIRSSYVNQDDYVYHKALNETIFNRPLDPVEETSLQNFLALREITTIRDLLKLRQFYLEEVGQKELAYVDNNNNPGIKTVPYAAVAVNFTAADGSFNSREVQSKLEEYLRESEKRKMQADPAISKPMIQSASASALRIVDQVYEGKNPLNTRDKSLLEVAMSVWTAEQMYAEKQKRQGREIVTLQMTDPSSPEYKELARRKTQDLAKVMSKNPSYREHAAEALTRHFLLAEAKKLRIAPTKEKLIKEQAEALVRQARMRYDFLSQSSTLRPSNGTPLDVTRPAILGLYDLHELEDSNGLLASLADGFEEIDFKMKPTSSGRFPKKDRVEPAPILLLDADLLNSIAVNLRQSVQFGPKQGAKEKTVEEIKAENAQEQKNEIVGARQRALFSYHLYSELKYLADQAEASGDSIRTITRNKDLSPDQIEGVMASTIDKYYNPKLFGQGSRLAEKVEANDRDAHAMLDLYRGRFERASLAGRKYARNQTAAMVAEKSGKTPLQILERNAQLAARFQYSDKYGKYRAEAKASPSSRPPIVPTNAVPSPVKDTNDKVTVRSAQ